MPHSDLHKRKRAKNLAVLALIAGWCILIFAVAVIRMKGS